MKFMNKKEKSQWMRRENEETKKEEKCVSGHIRMYKGNCKKKE